MQASKISFGRFSSRSSGSVASSVGSSTGADSDGKDDKLDAWLPSTTTEEVAGTKRYEGDVTRPAVAADDIIRAGEAVDPAAARQAAVDNVDARLAAGGDARADTGEPLGAAQEGQAHRAGVGVLSMPDTGEGETGPGASLAHEEGALTADMLAAQQAASRGGVGLADGMEPDSRDPSASQMPRGLQSAGNGTVDDPGTMLTAKTLARLDADAAAMDVSGLQRVQGQLDGSGRCRIMRNLTPLKAPVQ